MRYQDYLAGTASLLEQSQREKFPYTTIVLGREFVVHRNVFSPKYFRDTEIFARALPISQDGALLEIGTGTGAVGLTAVHRGVKTAVLTDRFVGAVNNAKENVKLHNMQQTISVRHGNLFKPIAPKELFDVIFWNIPFGFVARSSKGLSDLEKTVFDPNYRSLETFLKQAPKHLKPGGIIIAGFSSALGKMKNFTQAFQQAQLRPKLLHRELSEEVYPVYFELYKALE